MVLINIFSIKCHAKELCQSSFSCFAYFLVHDISGFTRFVQRCGWLGGQGMGTGYHLASSDQWSRQRIWSLLIQFVTNIERVGFLVTQRFTQRLRVLRYKSWLSGQYMNVMLFYHNEKKKERNLSFYLEVKYLVTLIIQKNKLNLFSVIM